MTDVKSNNVVELGDWTTVDLRIPRHSPRAEMGNSEFKECHCYTQAWTHGSTHTWGQDGHMHACRHRHTYTHTEIHTHVGVEGNLNLQVLTGTGILSASMEHFLQSSQYVSVINLGTFKTYCII